MRSTAPTVIPWTPNASYPLSPRAVVEAAGIRDILTKSKGSANILNVVKATLKALNELQDPLEVAQNRGVHVSRVQPFWVGRGNNG